MQDNAPAHKLIKSKAKNNGLRFESPSHPTNSPELAPSDFYLFPNLNIWLQGQRFSSNEEVKWETNDYFQGLDKSYYKRGIQVLKDRWTNSPVKLADFWPVLGNKSYSYQKNQRHSRGC